jgi:predicted porin
MKKTLIALAALASTAAFAQSSVTLYGVVDAGVYKQGSTTAATVDGNGGSRLGVKGEEDLGGGLAATFVVESAVNLAGGDTATTAGTVLGGNRGATVGLKGSFGSVDVGTRNLSPSFYALAAVETTGTANYGLSILTAADARNQKPAVQYTSPTMNGLTVRGSYVMADNQAAGVGSTNHLSAVYTTGGLTVAGYRVDNGATNDKFVGAKYNFGPAAVHLTSVDNAGTKATTYGLTAPMGAASLFIDYKNAKTGADTTIVGGTYNLSKSTFLYGAVNKTDNADTKTLVGIRKNF